MQMSDISLLISFNVSLEIVFLKILIFLKSVIMLRLVRKISQ